MDGQGRNLRQLTFSTSDERWPSISPDGTHIAYSSNEDGFYNAKNISSYRQLNNKNYIVFELPQDAATTRELLSSKGISFIQGEGCYKGKVNPSFIVSYDDATKVMKGYESYSLLEFIFDAGEECVLYLRSQKYNGEREASLIYDGHIKNIGSLVCCGSKPPTHGDYSLFNGLYYHVI